MDIVFECGAKSSDFREIVTVCMRVIDLWNNWKKKQGSVFFVSEYYEHNYILYNSNDKWCKFESDVCTID